MKCLYVLRNIEAQFKKKLNNFEAELKKKKHWLLKKGCACFLFDPDSSSLIIS